MTDSGRLGGKVALVTGAGQGIGEGIARALARAGADVVLAGRTASKVDSVCRDITAFGGSAVAVGCDVGVRADVDRAVATAVESFGGLDILVNNAQSTSQQSIADTTDEQVEIAWRSGPLGTLYGMQAALPYLKARGGGSIVNLGSGTAITGDRTFGSYAMAKEAIRGLSRVAVREFGQFGIRVNVIVPAGESPGLDAFRDKHPERYQAIVKSIPLGRMGNPETDIGAAVVALVSDDMTYVTGATLMLEGGMKILG